MNKTTGFWQLAAFGLGLLPALGLAAADGPRLPEISEGLKGYIHMRVPAPPAEFGFGVSFYASAWPLLEKPLADFQIGLPSTWIIPDNRNFNEPLCPIGTIARDQWAERGPSYRDVFQTIEGGLGFWVSTQFGSTSPKFRMNGTPNCYTVEISSPGWGFGHTTALAPDQMGLAQLSNRLLVPPDGITFQPGTCGELFGNAWMALPLTTATTNHTGSAVPTGDQSWTLFLNAANFKGPVAFWIPEIWSRIAQGYPTAAGRGLDTRPGIINGGAMEVNTVPRFVSADAHGVRYARVPRLQFPVDDAGRTVLMQDVTMYSRDALYQPLKSWLDGTGAAISGKFNETASYVPRCATDPIALRQGAENFRLTGIDATVDTRMFGPSSFGLQWKHASGMGFFPDYFKQDGSNLVAVAAAAVPDDTRLKEQSFAPATPGEPYLSPTGPGTVWTTPGPKAGPFQATLSDGTVVTFAWYRFVDQPSLQSLHLSTGAKARLQNFAERLHANWSTTREYMPPPSRGKLAALDGALIVAPPPGLEVGYVPIIIRQAAR